MAWAYAALPWFGLGLCLAVLVVLAVRWPLRLDLSARAQGEASGHWALAAGASVAAVSVTLIWARGTGPVMSFLCFGRKLAWKPSWSALLARGVPKPIQGASKRAWQRVDPLGLALQLLKERRHLRVRYLVLDLTYGFRDLLLTGRLVGALAVLSALLPPPIELRQSPRWDFEDGWQASLDGRVFVRPWLVLLDMLAYVVRQMTSRAAPEPRPLTAEGPSEAQLP